MSINVPTAVTRECAEFATGRIEECSTAKCKQGICILCADEKLLDVDPSKMRDKWSYCALSNKYFCSDCPNFCSKYHCWEGENQVDILQVLLYQYPQIETWLQSMEYHNTVTTSRSHAVQFLTLLMDSQPQFTQLIKLIQQQLKQHSLADMLQERYGFNR